MKKQSCKHSERKESRAEERAEARLSVKKREKVERMEQVKLNGRKK